MRQESWLTGGTDDSPGGSGLTPRQEEHTSEIWRAPVPGAGLGGNQFAEFGEPVGQEETSFTRLDPDVAAKALKFVEIINQQVGNGEEIARITSGYRHGIQQAWAAMSSWPSGASVVGYHNYGWAVHVEVPEPYRADFARWLRSEAGRSAKEEVGITNPYDSGDKWHFEWRPEGFSLPTFEPEFMANHISTIEKQVEEGVPWRKIEEDIHRRVSAQLERSGQKDKTPTWWGGLRPRVRGGPRQEVSKEEFLQEPVSARLIEPKEQAYDLREAVDSPLPRIRGLDIKTIGPTVPPREGTSIPVLAPELPEDTSIPVIGPTGSLMKDPYIIQEDPTEEEIFRSIDEPTGDMLALDASRLRAPKKEPRFEVVPPSHRQKEIWEMEEEERKYRESFPEHKPAATDPVWQMARDRAAEILV